MAQLYASGEHWELYVDDDAPITRLRVWGIPTGEDARGMGEAFYAYANELGGRPWAMLSDLREMELADRESQAQWIANMEMLMDVGLARWAVLNSNARASLQAAMVAKRARIDAITKITTDPGEADAWVRGVVTTADEA